MFPSLPASGVNNEMFRYAAPDPETGMDAGETPAFTSTVTNVPDAAKSLAADNLTDVGETTSATAPRETLFTVSLLPTTNPVVLFIVTTSLPSTNVTPPKFTPPTLAVAPDSAKALAADNLTDVGESTSAT